MHTRVSQHIRTNVVGYVALFFALSLGTAWALERNSVRSKHIVDGQVKGKDIAAGAVSSAKVADESLTRDDVLDDSLNGVDITDGTIGGADIADGSVTGAEVNEPTLGQVPSALLGGFGRTGPQSSCDPESATFVTCAATGPITVPAGAKALVLARVRAATELSPNSDAGNGTCRLGTSSTGVINNTSTVIVVDDAGDGQNAFEDMTLIGVSPPQAAGPVDFGIDCNQGSGAIVFNNAAASVVLISGS